MSNNKKPSGVNIVIVIIAVVLTLSVFVNIYTLYRLHEVEKDYDDMKVMIQKSDEANQQVLAMLKEVRDEQKKQSEMLNVSYMKRLEHEATLMNLKNNGFSPYSDIGSNTKITVEDMNKIIDYYDAHINGGTPFKGKGYVFVKASEETGLSPIYIFAHAAAESYYGKSYLAQTRHNYFGINAVDSNPGRANSMGDSIDEGIIEGAYWIKRHYYDNGYVNLRSMHDAGYASDPNWDDKISSIANTAISVL